MRKLHSIVGSIGAAVPAYFAAAAAPNSGVPYTLLQTAFPAIAGQIGNIANPVTLLSSATLAGVNFLVVGTNRAGQPYQEIIPGPASATTVQTRGLFATVTSITPIGTSGNTAAFGYGATNYGPLLYTGQQLVSVIARVVSGSPTFTVQAGNQNLLDPGFFLPDPVRGYEQVPASLQAACPQLLSTTQLIPEDDGTWSQLAGLGLTFTTATPGTTTNTADYQRSDPINVSGVRIVMNSGSGLVELDLQIQKPW